MDKNIVKIIKDKISQHHELYRFPVKAELWEDIFDQAINGKDSNWNGGGHSVGADVVSEGKDKTRYQNKSGDINLNKNTIKWNGHRTTSHKTIEEKLDFISKPHYDKYVMLGRNKKDWDNGIKRYWLLVFNADIIDYKALDWKETYGKNGEVNGWSGSEDNLSYTAKISKSMSDQLWTECDIDYLGKKIEILI
jgi:hypothetical protein